MFKGDYRGKRVMVTGHTGFKGGWLSLWLKELGAHVYGLSLPAPTQPSFHEVISPAVFASEKFCDVRDYAAVEAALAKAKPDVIFHLAAQALVRRSYAEPLETFHVNALGTANVLEAVKRLQLPGPVVIVTSDKCYENREWEYAYREVDSLGGHDVYSMSKAAAELVAQSWRRSFFQSNEKLGPVATVRAGNVIGGGDYAQDRIVPDCVRALIRGEAIQVRNPAAVRPWQHVLECLSGYLWLGACLQEDDSKKARLEGAFNFGPDPGARRAVRELVEAVLRSWPGRWADVSDPQQPHEAQLLTLSTEKAAALLSWVPCWDFETAVRQTTEWYRKRHFEKGTEMLAFSREQIGTYTTDARARNIRWSADS